MVDEESHSTDLSVSGAEGHSTILLTHYIFWFTEDKVIYQRWLRRKIAQKCLEILLLMYNLHVFSIRPKNVFVFSSNFRYKSNFLENLEHLMENPRFGVCLCICCGGELKGGGGWSGEE